MNDNARIARQLVRLAKSLVGARVTSVDFTDDENYLKTWCDASGYGFVSDNEPVDRTFTISTPFGDFKISSDLSGHEVGYDVGSDIDPEFNIKGLTCMDDAIVFIKRRIRKLQGVRFGD